MPAQQSAIGPLLVACGAAFMLSGCVAAAPLAQMAVTSAQTAATQQGQSCLQPGGCNTVVSNLSLQDLARQFNASVQKWTGDDGNSQAPVQPIPAR